MASPCKGASGSGAVCSHARCASACAVPLSHPHTGFAIFGVSVHWFIHFLHMVCRQDMVMPPQAPHLSSFHLVMILRPSVVTTARCSPVHGQSCRGTSGCAGRVIHTSRSLVSLCCVSSGIVSWQGPGSVLRGTFVSHPHRPGFAVPLAGWGPPGCLSWRASRSAAVSSASTSIRERWAFLPSTCHMLAHTPHQEFAVSSWSRSVATSLYDVAGARRGTPIRESPAGAHIPTATACLPSRDMAQAWSSIWQSLSSHRYSALTSHSLPLRHAAMRLGSPLVTVIPSRVVPCGVGRVHWPLAILLHFR